MIYQAPSAAATTPRPVGDEPIPVHREVTKRPVMDDWPLIRGDGLADPMKLEGSFAHIDMIFYQLSWRRLVILGAAGSGKTEIGLHLARRLLQPAPDIVPCSTEDGGTGGVAVDAGGGRVRRRRRVLHPSGRRFDPCRVHQLDQHVSMLLVRSDRELRRVAASIRVRP